MTTTATATTVVTSAEAQDTHAHIDNLSYLASTNRNTKNNNDQQDTFITITNIVFIEQNEDEIMSSMMYNWIMFNLFALVARILRILPPLRLNEERRKKTIAIFFSVLFRTYEMMIERKTETKNKNETKENNT